MELDYPHLDDTEFPMASNIDVYEYHNEFDYSRWTDNVKLKVCNVPWESDFTHAVYFENSKERDKWFDELQGDSYEMDTMFHVLPDGTIKLPIPYDVMLSYNYLVVDVPVMTSEGQPIEYVNSNRYQRTFWFVQFVEQLAPNTTLCTLTQDWWTGYVYDVNITYMVLKRGHAPMLKTTVEKFLENPIENNEWLLSHDISYGDDTNVRGQRWYPFGNGEKYVVLAATMDMGSLTGDNDRVAQQYTNATFIDVDEEDLNIGPHTIFDGGTTHRVYQDYGVTDFEWGLDGWDYTDNTVNNIPHADYGTSTTLTMWAVKADEANEFLRKLASIYPQFFSCIVGAFDVSREMFTVERQYTVCDQTVYKIGATENVLGELKLDKEDFDYDSRYADIAKLYTFPYAYLDMEDTDGTHIQIRVEELGESATLKFKTCMNFPWVNYTAFFDGIGGTAQDVQFQWRTVRGTTENRTIAGDDWQKLMFSHDIPVFSIYQLAKERYAADNAGSKNTTRQMAVNEYESNDDEANTQDGGVTSVTIDYGDGLSVQAGGNSWELAQVQRWNTKHVADANYDAAVTRNNATRDAEMASAVQSNKNAKYACTANEAVSQRNSLANANVMLANNRKIQVDYQTASMQTTYTANIENGTLLSTTLIGGATTFATSTATGAITGTAVPGLGTAAGAIIGAGIGAAQASAALASYPIVAGKNVELADLSVACSQRTGWSAQDLNSTTLGVTDGYTLTGRTSDSASYAVVGTYANGISWQNTHQMQEVIRRQSRELNARNGYDSETVNGVNVTNAQNLCTARNNAADTTRDAEVLAADKLRYQNKKNSSATQNSRTRQAKRTMYNRRLNWFAGYEDAKHQANIQLNASSGNALSDVYRWRGVQVKVRTQPVDAIAQAGDQMLRFGYMLDRNWEFDGFNLMKHFTYWQVEEVWLTGGNKGLVEEAQNEIKRILHDGVTIWHNPSDVCNVSIYDNME